MPKLGLAKQSGHRLKHSAFCYRMAAARAATSVIGTRGEAMLSERVRRAILVIIGATLLIFAVAAAPAMASRLGDPDARTPDDPVYAVDLTSDANGFTWTGTESVT